MKKVFIIILCLGILSCQNQEDNLFTQKEQNSIVEDSKNTNNSESRTMDILITPPDENGGGAGNGCESSHSILGGCTPDINGNAGGSFAINYDLESDCDKVVFIGGVFRVNNNLPRITEFKIKKKKGNLKVNGYNLSYNNNTGEFIATLLITIPNQSTAITNPIGYDGNIDLVDPDLSVMPEDDNGDGHISPDEVDWTPTGSTPTIISPNYSIKIKQFKINPCVGYINY
ncbi:hypothetical protein SAMN04489761_2471 [Tenacibaculum sp. MAR_2009_124]|uniref:hypothetical protein n=1 Tax=Tenacibaculum sp. MAR_2009_124 TaxID=1250059 RepID=UPI000897DC34|nr:hypothetical protein [Tenacibaculum sp. MAR_2009_124]SEC24449.1 hypothetical protein SAMN04489761_2471 [Tenacibaculum sp. MAR_2009_124]